MMNTILIIDDNQDYRSDLAEVLGFENYATLQAENGLIGWEMIRQHLPNLIICDIDMPVMDGLEVLKRTKTDSLLAKIPFLLVSGRKDKRTIKIATDLGAEQYLLKPFMIADFLSVIGSVLNSLV